MLITFTAYITTWERISTEMSFSQVKIFPNNVGDIMGSTCGKQGVWERSLEKKKGVWESYPITRLLVGIKSERKRKRKKKKKGKESRF